MKKRRLRDEARRVICTGTYEECKDCRVSRTVEEDGGPLYCSKVSDENLE